MSLLIVITVVMVTLLITSLILCRSVYVLVKRIRVLEKELKDTTSIMINMTNLFTSILTILKEANKLLLLGAKKDRTTPGDEALKGEITMH